MLHRLPFGYLALGLVLFSFGTFPGLAFADRPSTPELLPADTLFYFSINDVQELISQAPETNLGRLVNDPAVRSTLEQFLVEVEQQLAGDWSEELSSTELQLISLIEFFTDSEFAVDDLLGVPQGELTIACVNLPEELPAFFATVGTREQPEVLSRLIDQLEQYAQADGWDRSTQTIAQTELTLLESRESEQFFYFQQEGYLTIVTSEALAQQVISRWNGVRALQDEELETLNENDRFNSITSLSRTSGSNTPQVEWYVDPIGVARAVGRGNARAQVALAFLPVLGVDTLEAIGGTLQLGGESLEYALQVHVLIDPPRAGVMELIELESVELAPEPWIPSSVARYTTMQWDIESTYRALEGVYDSIRGESSFQENVIDPINQELEIDLELDLLLQMTGRISNFEWHSPNAPFYRRSWGVSLQVDQPEMLAEVLEAKCRDAFLSEVTFGTHRYYREPADPFDEEQLDADLAAQEETEQVIMASVPCLALIDDRLVIVTNPILMEELLLNLDTGDALLTDESDYQRTVDVLRNELGLTPRGLFSFRRPATKLEIHHRFFTNERFQSAGERLSETNLLYHAWEQARETSPLPPLESMLNYVGPAGSLLTHDEAGLHYTRFSLRPEIAETE